MAPSKLTYDRLITKLEGSIKNLPEQFPGRKNASRAEAIQAILQDALNTARAGASGAADILSPGKLKRKIAADIQAAHESIDAANILQSFSSRKRPFAELASSPDPIHPTPRVLPPKKKLKQSFLPLPSHAAFEGMSAPQIFFLGVEYGIENTIRHTSYSFEKVKDIFGPEQQFRRFVMEEFELERVERASHVSISDDVSSDEVNY